MTSNARRLPLESKNNHVNLTLVDFPQHADENVDSLSEQRQR